MKIDISRVSLLEKDIEEYLYQNPNSVFYEYAGQQVHVERWLHRQFTVPSGIIDLVGVLENKQIAVVEVKLGAINSQAITQVCRYGYDIEAILYHASEQSEASPIMKFVVGDSLADKAMFECNALRVIPLTYSVSMNLSTAVRTFTDEYWSQMREQYKTIAKDLALSEHQKYWDEQHATIWGLNKEESLTEEIQPEEVSDVTSQI